MASNLMPIADARNTAELRGFYGSSANFFTLSVRSPR